MAKKKIISDFSALKGKMTFSEQSSDVYAAKDNAADSGKGKVGLGCGGSKREVSQGCLVGQSGVAQRDEQISGNVLKVGQKVVLMDSDLRGRIVSLGRTVGIELEDGLVIKAAYGEFAVTNAEEISALKQSRVKAPKNRMPSKTSLAKGSSLSKSNTNTFEVDLHIEALPDGRNVPKGQQLEFQMEIFRKVIRENMRHRGRTITFIHGVGDGILKAAIRKELDEVLALRCSYSVGDPAVTVVSII